MRNKYTLSISEARRKIFDIAEQVQKPETFYTLTENGDRKVVIMSAEQFDSLMEDLEILGDPEAIKNIKRAEGEYGRGKYVSWANLKKELGFVEQPLMVADKVRMPYQVKARKSRKSRS